MAGSIGFADTNSLSIGLIDTLMDTMDTMGGWMDGWDPRLWHVPYVLGCIIVRVTPSMLLQSPGPRSESWGCVVPMSSLHQVEPIGISKGTLCFLPPFFLFLPFLPFLWFSFPFLPFLCFPFLYLLCLPFLCLPFWPSCSSFPSSPSSSSSFPFLFLSQELQSAWVLELQWPLAQVLVSNKEQALRWPLAQGPV